MYLAVITYLDFKKYIYCNTEEYEYALTYHSQTRAINNIHVINMVESV